MKEKFMRFILPFVLILYFGSAAPIVGQAPKQKPASGKSGVSDPAPRPYSKDISELPSRFNKDKGKVRLVVILSPT